MDASLGNVERGGGVLFPPPILGGSVFVGEVEAQNEGAWRFTSWDGWLCTALPTPRGVGGAGWGPSGPQTYLQHSVKSLGDDFDRRTRKAPS